MRINTLKHRPSRFRREWFSTRREVMAHVTKSLEKRERKLECAVCGDWASRIQGGRAVCNSCAEPM